MGRHTTGESERKKESERRRRREKDGYKEHSRFLPIEHLVELYKMNVANRIFSIENKKVTHAD